jgi:hypothetical protein
VIQPLRLGPGWSGAGCETGAMAFLLAPAAKVNGLRDFAMMHTNTMIKSVRKGLCYSLRLMRHLAGQAKLQAASRLPQHAPYLGYWYDPNINALVGLHVGVDLHRYGGRYHAVETNLGPTLRPQRRALYDRRLDPIISALVSAASDRGFERLEFVRKPEWCQSYLDEFELASRQSGLQVHGLTELPENLSANTIYVMDTQRSLLSQFVHDKYWSAKWLKETIDAEADRIKLLASVPTFDHVVLPEDSGDTGWPNLVIKLSNVDRGEAVLFGRFRSREHARQALRNLRFSSGAFGVKWRHQLFHRTIYQPFVRPEVLDNRPRCIRLHSFVSPLFSAFLSAHVRVGRMELPSHVVEGLIDRNNPFLASFSAGAATYARVESRVEEELRVVAEEFGRVANLAINRKFQTAPAIADAASRRRSSYRGIQV